MRLLQPKLVVETGVGQGFVTRRLAARLGPGQRLVAFEPNPDMRLQLEHLPFFAASNCSLARAPSPGADDLACAELTVLDSDASICLAQLDHWAKVAKPRAVLLVHGSGNGHGPETGTAPVIRKRIEELGIWGRSPSKSARAAFSGSSCVTATPLGPPVSLRDDRAAASEVDLNAAVRHAMSSPRRKLHRARHSRGGVPGGRGRSSPGTEAGRSASGCLGTATRQAFRSDRRRSGTTSRRYRRDLCTRLPCRRRLRICRIRATSLSRA